MRDQVKSLSTKDKITLILHYRLGRLPTLDEFGDYANELNGVGLLFVDEHLEHEIKKSEKITLTSK